MTRLLRTELSRLATTIEYIFRGEPFYYFWRWKSHSPLNGGFCWSRINRGSFGSASVNPKKQKINWNPRTGLPSPSRGWSAATSARRRRSHGSLHAAAAAWSACHGSPSSHHRRCRHHPHLLPLCLDAQPESAASDWPDPPCGSPRRVGGRLVFGSCFHPPLWLRLRWPHRLERRHHRGRAGASDGWTGGRCNNRMEERRWGGARASGGCNMERRERVAQGRQPPVEERESKRKRKREVAGWVMKP